VIKRGEIWEGIRGLKWRSGRKEGGEEGGGGGREGDETTEWKRGMRGQGPGGGRD